MTLKCRLRAARKELKEGQRQLEAAESEARETKYALQHRAREVGLLKLASEAYVAQLEELQTLGSNNGSLEAARKVRRPMYTAKRTISCCTLCCTHTLCCANPAGRLVNMIFLL